MNLCLLPILFSASLPLVVQAHQHLSRSGGIDALDLESILERVSRLDKLVQEQQHKIHELQQRTIHGPQEPANMALERLEETDWVHFGGTVPAKCSADGIAEETKDLGYCKRRECMDYCGKDCEGQACPADMCEMKEARVLYEHKMSRSPVTRKLNWCVPHGFDAETKNVDRNWIHVM